MSIVQGHRCDTCNGLDTTTHPDDGPGTGWYLVAQMNRPGSWQDDWHFCSAECLNEFTWDGDDDAPTVHHEALSHEAFPGCCDQDGAA